MSDAVQIPDGAEERLMDLILDFERAATNALEDVANEDLEQIVADYKGKDGSLAANMWAVATVILLHRRLSALGKLMPQGSTLMSFHELMMIEERTKGQS